MAKKRKQFNWTVVLLFVTVVAISGVALSHTRYWDNPLRQFIGSSGEQRELSESGELPEGFEQDAMPSEGDVEASFSEAPQRMPEGGAPGGSGAGLALIEWSQFGSVAFNLWFLFASTAAVIIAARLVGYVIRTVRRQSTHVAVS